MGPWNFPFATVQVAGGLANHIAFGQFKKLLAAGLGPPFDFSRCPRIDDDLIMVVAVLGQSAGDQDPGVDKDNAVRLDYGVCYTRWQLQVARLDLRLGAATVNQSVADITSCSLLINICVTLAKMTGRSFETFIKRT